jgi:hypothetical protein
MVSRVDGLDRGVRSGMCRAQPPNLPPPQRTSAPTTWRETWQTLSHRMCAMMLNQDNLAAEHVVRLPVCGVHLRHAVCHGGDATAHPRAHVWMEVRPRTLHSVLPRSAGHVPQCTGIGRSSRLTSSLCYRVPLCHTICAHLVLLEGGRQLQVRSGVQAVGLELADLTHAEAANSTRDAAQ